MTQAPDNNPPLDPPDQELALRLAGERPVPAAEFRGALGRRLIETDPDYGPRPERLRMNVALYLGAGAAFTALGALQALGAL